MENAYLVQYGRSAFVGRFVASPTESYERGDRVIIRSVRGVELGTVMCLASERFSRRFEAASSAPILRHATDADREGSESLASTIFHDAEQLVEHAGLSVTVLDAEVLLEEGPVILHVLPWAECDLDPLLDELSYQYSRPFWILDVSRTPISSEPQVGCGKTGCGSSGGGCTSCGTGGGCSTGGCSRGSVKSAGELTSYFAELREKMHAASSGRTSLH